PTQRSDPAVRPERDAPAPGRHCRPNGVPARCPPAGDPAGPACDPPPPPGPAPSPPGCRPGRTSPAAAGDRRTARAGGSLPDLGQLGAHGVDDRPVVGLAE